MTLQDLLKPLGIKTYTDLADKTGLSKQLSNLLWRGKTFPGWRSAKIIHEATGVKLEHLLAIRENGR